MDGSWPAIDPGARFMAHGQAAAEAAGAGLVEAARGALGHWLRIEKGRIAGYQIIAPTTWNFSPRDAGGVPGPVEAALEGAAVRCRRDDAAVGAAYRAQLRSLHGLHGALMASGTNGARPPGAPPPDPRGYFRKRVSWRRACGSGCGGRCRAWGSGPSSGSWRRSCGCAGEVLNDPEGVLI